MCQRVVSMAVQSVALKAAHLVGLRAVLSAGQWARKAVEQTAGLKVELWAAQRDEKLVVARAARTVGSLAVDWAAHSVESSAGSKAALLGWRMAD